MSYVLSPFMNSFSPECKNASALPSAAVLELLPVAAYVTDGDGVIVRYNRLAAALWGRAEASAGSHAGRYCGAGCAFEAGGAEMAPEETPVARALREGVGRSAQDVLVRRADGSRAWWSMDVAVARDAGGAVAGAVCCFRDVTATREELGRALGERQGVEAMHEAQRRELLAAKEAAEAARETAEAANRAKDDFLAALSHELRTPLSPVLLTASALAHDPAVPAAVREDVELIQRSVELEARLIDDLLDLTRITRGKLQLHPETVDAHALLRQAVQTCRGSDVDNKSLHIDLELTAMHSTVRADPARLQQVFWNLVKNAVKFTPAGGHVTVVTRDWFAQTAGDGNGDGAEPRLVIEVRDTGIGIEPAALPSIFNAFQQADGSIGKRFGGLGLGLAICRSLVDLHGGTIRAHSAGEGQGATFTLELPAAASAGLRRAEGGPVASMPRGLRILLVEDHDTTLKVLTRLLGRMGHDVVPAANCQDALAAASNGHAFDVLISDIGLPDGTGHQLLGKLRPLQPRLRTIALSGFGMDQDIRRSLDAGFHTHLVKPVHFEKLKGAIGQLFA
jgi:signal transduction histidine kinase